MDIALWILAVVLATAFTIGAIAQLTLPKHRYRSLGASQHWADDFGQGHIRAIGTIKLLGALGLVLPALTGTLPVLSALAPVGLMLFMTGAATIRFRRSEWAYMAGDVLFIAAFAFLAWGRLVLIPYGA